MATQQTDFSQGSVKRRVLAQALPLMLAQAVQLLYNIVDRIYIGRLPGEGDLALTGLGVTFPVIVLIAAFTCLFGNGGMTLFSIARGQRNEEEAERILGNVFALLSVAAASLFVFCYCLRRPILFAFGASEQSFAYANAYLKIYLFGTAFSMFATGLNGYINAQGFPRIGMLTTILGASLNVALDPVFIFALDMGVQGAALATVLSQAVSALWVLRFLTGKKAILRLKRSAIHIDLRRTGRICALGLPSFVVQGTNSLVQILCNTQLQAYGGDLYVGIMTVIASVREMIFLPVSGISAGAQPVLGFNYGAKEYGRVKEAIRFTSLIAFSYTFLMWIFVRLFPQQLMGIFSTEAQTIVVGAQMMNLYFCGFVFMAGQFSGQMVFQALGRAKRAICFSLLRKVAIVTPLTLLLPALGLGVKGVFLAEPISNAVGGMAAFLTMYFTEYRKL